MFQSKNADASFAEELPYWDFVDGPVPHAILTDGSLAGGLRLSLIDIECLDDQDINQFTFGLRTALNSISEGVTVQFCLSVGSDYTDMLIKHVQGKSEQMHPLVASIAEYREQALHKALEEAQLYRPELFVFLKVPQIERKKIGILRKSREFQEVSADAYQETLEALSECLDGILSSMASVGLNGGILSKEDLLSRVYSFLNPKRSQTDRPPKLVTADGPDLEADLLEDVEWLASQSPREQLAFGDLILGFDQFTLDSHYHRVVSLKSLPELTFAGQLSNFLRMPFHYDLILSFEVPPQASEMAKLQQKRKMAHSLAVTQGNRASDLESETKLNSTEELIRELLSTGQRIYAAQLVMAMRAPASPDGTKRLNRQVREVLSRFRSLQGAEGLEESVGAWKIVKGSLPAAPMVLERARKVKTNNLADFLPVYGPRTGDEDPAVIFRNRLNGLFAFNPFDPGLPNYNALVTGSSGAGKSFLNNCILTQELARGLRVFIIDIGGSYRKLTEALDGQYLEMNLSEQYRLNPFAIPDVAMGPSDQKLKSLLAVIESMVVESEASKLPKLDRVLLEKAIMELYREKASSGEVPILSDLVAKLEKCPEVSMQTIAKVLYMWTGGRPYGKLMDGHGSLDVHAKICTFDLKGLSSYPDLQSVLILILTDFILTQVDQDKINKKRIILDEAWQLLKSNAAANFMEYCARTLRKSGSGITFITQGLEEIVADDLKDSIGAAILGCTSTKFILLQAGDTEILRSTLKLNSQELDLIQSLEQRKGEYSEAFMIEGKHRQVVRIYPTPFEYWLSTTDPPDNNYLSELRSTGLSLIEAIKVAARIFPNGFSQGKKEGL